jgi:putative pyruvate formate lyase activating enzyme
LGKAVARFLNPFNFLTPGKVSRYHKEKMARPMEAAYLRAYREHYLEERVEKAWKILEHCTLCPRRCRVNRLKGEKGVCEGGLLPEVSSYAPHFGEERPLVGTGGSGTIFFTHCNLGCLFCQNYEISHLGEGRPVSFERLAAMMVELQHLGCLNINFVTPTHFVPQILKALPLAIEKGLQVPLVYNTGGYDALETLQLLDGLVDIYMPDFKFVSSEVAQSLAQAPDYPEVAKKAIREMHRQVGDLVLDEKGRARRGLLVRHLVLPANLAGTAEVMRFLAEEISKNTYVNVMDQYRPCGEVQPGSVLDRYLRSEEYEEAVASALKAGLHRLDRKEIWPIVW